MQLYGVPEGWHEFLERVAANRGTTPEMVLLEAIMEFYKKHWQEGN